MSAKKCSGARKDCTGLEGVLQKMFDYDNDCELILNKSHGGSSDVETGTYRRLYTKVPPNVTVIEVGSHGYSNWGHAIPWVMEVIRLIHEHILVDGVMDCPPWPDIGEWITIDYPHIKELLEGMTTGDNDTKLKQIIRSGL